MTHIDQNMKVNVISFENPNSTSFTAWFSGKISKGKGFTLKCMEFKEIFTHITSRYLRRCLHVALRGPLHGWAVLVEEYSSSQHLLVSWGFMAADNNNRRPCPVTTRRGVLVKKCPT